MEFELDRDRDVLYIRFNDPGLYFTVAEFTDAEIVLSKDMSTGTLLQIHIYFFLEYWSEHMDELITLVRQYIKESP